MSELWRPPPHRDLPLAVTMGDPAGVGLQVTVQAWRHRAQLGLPAFALFTNEAALQVHTKALGQAVPICRVNSVSEAGSAFQDALPILPIDMPAPVRLGETDPAHAPATEMAIAQAVTAVCKGEASGIVTNPITKATMTAKGFGYPGHTEFLGALAKKLFPGHDPNSAPVMMLACDTLRVVPLTVHMPLKDVPQHLTAAHLTATLATLSKALRIDFGISAPRIAVSGLNPHAGERATLGREEQDIIEPTLNCLRKDGMKLLGPLPADTMFHEAARRTYDAALCMYHDQALIPLKTLAFDRGVNITLGLPFVRTSPDHGSALKIAGTSEVSAESFVASLKAAHQIADNRAAFARSHEAGDGAAQPSDRPKQ